MFLLLTLACTDYDLVKDDDVGEPTRDSDPGCPPSFPNCHDSAVDSDEPIDTQIENPDDCDVSVASAGTVTVVDECVGTGGSGGSVDDAFDLVIEYQYTSAGSGSIVMPAIGNVDDDNGDGVVDENDTPDIAFTTWSANTLVVLSGDGSGPIFEVSGFTGQGGVTIADVDSDGDPEVIAITTGNQIAAVNSSGSKEWTSSSFGMMAYPQPAVADLDADGKPEVIGDVGIVNGEDGSTVASLSGLNNSWRTPVAADIDLDGDQEVILANGVFGPTGSLEWSNGGSGSGNFAAVADIDSDPEGEVFFVSGSVLYIHEDDGSLIRQVTIPGSNPGPPSVADFDGDGEVEIAIPANSRLSVWDVDGTMLWDATINDSSGLAGCSGYDMDGDGAYEVLYADQDALRMYDGATGAVLYENYSHSSGTVWEYPVIADIDGDQSAEICISSNGGTYKGVTCFGHAGDGWPRSGPTWGTHDFAVTNLEPDGSVPKVPEVSWKNYNVFRARPAVDDPSTSDVAGSLIDLCVADCNDGPIKLSFQAYNAGGETLEAGTPWALYKNDAGTLTLVQTGALSAELASGEKGEGFVVTVGPEDLGLNGFVLSLDDDGTGVGSVDECDEDNNLVEFPDKICQ